MGSGEVREMLGRCWILNNTAKDMLATKVPKVFGLLSLGGLEDWKLKDFEGWGRNVKSQSRSNSLLGRSKFPD